MDYCVLASGYEGWVFAVLRASEGRDVLLLDATHLRPLSLSISLAVRENLLRNPAEPAPLTGEKFESTFLEVVLPEARFTAECGISCIDAHLQDLRYSGEERRDLAGKVRKCLGLLPPFREPQALTDFHLRRGRPVSRSVRVWLKEMACFHRVRVEKCDLEHVMKFFNYV